ncbi:acriflavin resistance protein [Alkalidesulfovibrio alkalitolerans DSM 16529]|jgi:HAE1 family hydrophobic/amphiphilic exporter-1|uniref:Acriflavin resistance protein n=1 Tax=Alkalidesulfovibrio alkalitolerans DSM 16529 TaxID=1121439 RepID=S7T340_9BACT|nr:efflux RND transporter permease subunit [Alkalidesulfovibrio alkalitolerans]EPR31006.1 acriflavin resistance protein [Alkalidesulfovibrio alkalitolerans DSM 16529]
MDAIRFAINNPVTVLVGVISVVMFGLIGLAGLPYQLSPDVTEPEITVTTMWPGATPYEVERDIIEEQEKVLKGIPGLREMTSEAFNSQGNITLTFEIGVGVDDALLRVSNKLNEVPSYPETAERPVIVATGANTSPVIWMVLKPLPENTRDIATYRTYLENEVRQYIERVPGVADLFIGGGTDREMHVIVDPLRLAAHGLTIADVSAVLSGENANVAAGIMDVGRRAYRIRSVGEFASPEDIREVVIVSTGQTRVTVGDVAEVEFGYKRKDTAMLHNGAPGIAIGVKPEPGANILDMTDAVEVVVREMNEGRLKDNGVYLDWTYDQRPYITGAIDLVRQNILIGGVLAALVLLVFLRSISSTTIVGVAIPISVIGCFIFLSAFGRNLNVVSMAGISFAVGMLVDSAIVVLENIDRHRSMGKNAFSAAYDGAREVWGAVFASAATTVAVFLPVVFIQEEAGQLFKDIAIAVTCAISLSLFVSVLVIPMLASQFYKRAKPKDPSAAERSLIGRFGRRVGEFLTSLVEICIRSVTSRLVTIVGLTGLAVLLTWAFFPKMEYLPQGNRNLILSILVPPPGLSYEERFAMGESIFAQAEPHMRKEVDGLPGIQNMFFVSGDQFNILGAISTEEQRAGELLPKLRAWVNSIPGVFGISLQAGIFQTNISQGRTISLDFSGPDIDTLVAAAGASFGQVSQAIPGAQIRPVPSLEMLYPEIVLTPNRDRVRAANMSAVELGRAVDVLMDGRKVGEFKEPGEKTIDLVLMGQRGEHRTPEDIHSALIATPGGQVVPVSSLAQLTRTYGITQIRHFERRRTITLEISPPETIPLQQAMDIIDEQIVPAVRGMGLLRGIDVSMSGAADKLTATRLALQDNFLLALAITYLLMSALFGNFIYPLIILFTVPLAAAGGFAMLKLQNLLVSPQPLDVVTMLGFIILVGAVVNNAILIVYQSVNNVRYNGMQGIEAIIDATRTRLRPIYMSTTTSIFGMLPLAVAPGPGSELYRGLGAVVLGGLAVSTIFTVFVIPCLLAFLIGMEKPRSAENGV